MYPVESASGVDSAGLPQECVEVCKRRTQLGRDPTMRILITVKPRMYREAIAASIHRHRPDAEIVLAPRVPGRGAETLPAAPDLTQLHRGDLPGDAGGRGAPGLGALQRWHGRR